VFDAAAAAIDSNESPSWTGGSTKGEEAAQALGDQGEDREATGVAAVLDSDCLTVVVPAMI